MSISSAVASSYAAKTTGAAGNFYASITATGNAAKQTKASSSSDTVVTLSNKALELLRGRQVSDETTQQFKDILAQASAANAQNDPKTFLNSLSPTQMEVLRKVHSLADTIDTASLSTEGAANLLVQPGSAEDLDNNGLTTVGAGNSFSFPPKNAPESFKAAWASATEGMSFADIPTHMQFAVGLANMHYDDKTSQVSFAAPGDANWSNPYADSNYNYKDAVGDIMSSLKTEYQHNMISKEQYQHDSGFYTRLSKAMG